MVTLEEFVEHLYDLDRRELRLLAYEALLISDGPDHIEGETLGAAIRVVHYGEGVQGSVFAVAHALVPEE